MCPALSTVTFAVDTRRVRLFLERGSRGVAERKDEHVTKRGSSPQIPLPLLHQLQMGLSTDSFVSSFLVKAGIARPEVRRGTGWILTRLRLTGTLNSDLDLGTRLWASAFEVRVAREQAVKGNRKSNPLNDTNTLVSRLDEMRTF